MCGLGRTGANFAIEHWSVAPDMIAAGKGLGSGYFPVAACMISERIMDTMQARRAGFEGVHTHCGHVLASRVAAAVLDYMARNELAENSKKQGELLLQGLKEIRDSQACVGDVRGLGLMCGVEFVQDKATREAILPAGAEGGRARHGRLPGSGADRLSRPRHGGRDSRRPPLLGPPLIITAGEVKQMLAILKEGIAAVQKTIAA